MRLHGCLSFLLSAVLLGCGARSSLLAGEAAEGAGGSPTTGPSCAEPQWAVSFGSNSGGNTVGTFVRRVSTAADGRVLAFGSFTGTLTAGAQTITAVGGDDYFLLMLDPCGEPLWLKRIGDDSGDTAKNGDAVLDAAGNVLFTGGVIGPLDLGSGPVGDSSEIEAVVAKLDPQGQPLWAQRFGGGSYQTGRRIMAGLGGEIAVVGVFTGEMTVAGQSITSGQFGSDPFLVRLSPDGDVKGKVQAFPYGTPGNLHTATMAPNGDVLMALYYSDGLPPVPVPAGFGVAIVRVSGDSPEIVGLFNESPSVVLGLHPRQGGLFITGKRFGELSYQEPGGVPVELPYEYSDFLVRTGGEAGIPLLESVGASVLLHASYATADDLYLTGTFSSDAGVLGQSASLPTGTFVARATADLEGAYLLELGGSGTRDFAAVFADSSGAMLIGGSFSGTLDFGSGPITSKGSEASQVDGFVARVLEEGGP